MLKRLVCLNWATLIKALSSNVRCADYFCNYLCGCTCILHSTLLWWDNTGCAAAVANNDENVDADCDNGGDFVDDPDGDAGDEDNDENDDDDADCDNGGDFVDDPDGDAGDDDDENDDDDADCDNGGDFVNDPDGDAGDDDDDDENDDDGADCDNGGDFVDDPDGDGDAGDDAWKTDLLYCCKDKLQKQTVDWVAI